ncbi:hypothetical protein G8759_07180 [Spirosoma aureum]|uniref:Uncharacterized protein n=1 Tax=Spirosoma aureum TaxID=2692134 RepID=A0A6G9AJA7_9BACT|nr:hypothetical protein [Spirosoma aureum]QIP12424.1 hypothetical protein G8759_07180 [Spirosoma aureum]
MNTKLMFLALGLLLLIVSFWIKDDAFDIQLYATYYVIGWGSLFRGVGLLCCLVEGVSFMLKHQVSRQK